MAETKKPAIQEVFHAQEEVQKQRTSQIAAEGPARFVTATEVQRTNSHVYIEARDDRGRVAYHQMIPIQDFKPSKFTGKFAWGGKVVDV